MNKTIMTAEDYVTHEMRLQPKPFRMIKSGKKTIELRLYDEKRRKIKVGDTVIFTDTVSRERLCATVLRLHRFDSFKELYSSLPLLACGYTEDSIGSADPTDMDAYYTPEEQEKYGVLGIEISLS